MFESIDDVIAKIDRVDIDNNPLTEWDVINLLGDLTDLHDRIEEAIEN